MVSLDLNLLPSVTNFMYRPTSYPFQSFKATLTKRKKQHYQINELIKENFGLFDDYISAETVWLAMKEKGIQLSISSFYNRLKELVDAEVIEKKPYGYNKFVYKVTIALTSPGPGG